MPESLHTVLPRDIATDKEVKSNIFEKLKSCIKQGRRSFLFLTYVKAIWKYLHLKNMNISTPWTLKILFIFRERGRQGERERERNINVWLPLARPLLGTWPATEACALTRNPTGDPLVHRPALNPLSHTSQGMGEHSYLLRQTRIGSKCP